MDRRQAIFSAEHELSELVRQRAEVFQNFAAYGATSNGGLSFSTDGTNLSANYFDIELVANDRLVNLGDFKFCIEIEFSWTNFGGESFGIWNCYIEANGRVFELVDGEKSDLGWLGSPSVFRAISNELIFACLTGPPMKV